MNIIGGWVGPWTHSFDKLRLERVESNELRWFQSQAIRCEDDKSFKVLPLCC